MHELRQHQRVQLALFRWREHCCRRIVVWSRVRGSDSSCRDGRPRPSGPGAARQNGLGVKRQAQFAICVRNKDYPASLELRKVYRLLADEEASKHHQMRVVDESGEDYLYPADYFVPIRLPQAVKKLLAVEAQQVRSAK